MHLNGTAKKYRVLVLLILVTSVAIQSCGSRSVFSRSADKEFREMVGPALRTDRLIVSTDKREYASEEGIHLWIDNRTGRTLWFPNHIYGMEAYRYDKERKQWEKIPLYIVISTPRKLSVSPGVHGPDVLPVPGGHETGPLRLLFVGSTDPKKPGESGEVYKTYVDIVVLEEKK